MVQQEKLIQQTLYSIASEHVLNHVESNVFIVIKAVPEEKNWFLDTPGGIAMIAVLVAVGLAAIGVCVLGVGVLLNLSIRLVIYISCTNCVLCFFFLNGSCL